MAAHTRRSMVSLYSHHASVAVNNASNVSMSDALAPLVCCRPQARATGPNAAPKPAIAKRRGMSALCTRASRAEACSDRAPIRAAPAYNSAAVVKAIKPLLSQYDQNAVDYLENIKTEIKWVPPVPPKGTSTVAPT